MVFGAGVGILVVNGEANGDLERRGVSHAAFLALIHVVFQLHGHRVAALVAESGSVLVKSAALLADDVAGLVRIGDDGSAAIATSGAQVMQTLQVAALAFPVPDGVVHEFELRHFAEILDREHRSEDRLQASILALAGQQIHLQKALVRFLLDFDQVRDLDRTLNLRKIQALAFANVLVAIGHA